MNLLDSIKNPADLKKLKVDELPKLADEIRERIIEVTRTNGGHLASSLGAVDVIIALYYVFDFPKDKLIFDVGHQSYAHKILSERAEQFETIRTAGGLSGFPNIFESEYDSFTVGHAGTSIPAAFGYAKARDALGDDYFVISLVGDASLFNGENLEALFSLEDKPTKFLVILNDNGMSISKNDNAVYKIFSKISMKRKYSKFMRFMDRLLGWNFIGRSLKKLKASFKRSLDPYSILDTVGIKYVGAFDGNNIKLLVELLQSFKKSPRTTLLHIKTKKGKGFEQAEKESELYHGIGKNFTVSKNTFSEAAGKSVVELAQNDDKIAVITAGMTYGTGMTEFSKRFPDRYFDVGICEEFAVTFSAGLAIAGMKPIVCIYSTFLQRGYDQIMMDVCLQNLPVVFLIDRAGFVGVDGVTHQGLYDLSYLRHVPNIKIMTPKDDIEFKDIIEYALSLKSPVAIRYPNGINDEFPTHTPISRKTIWETVKEGRRVCLLAAGARMLKIASEAAERTGAMVVNARSIKPLDEQLLDKIKRYRIITLEDNTSVGGFGSSVLEYYAKNGVQADVKVLGADDEFVPHASVSEQLENNGLTVERVRKLL